MYTSLSLAEISNLEYLNRSEGDSAPPPRILSHGIQFTAHHPLGSTSSFLLSYFVPPPVPQIFAIRAEQTHSTKSVNMKIKHPITLGLILIFLGCKVDSVPKRSCEQINGGCENQSKSNRPIRATIIPVVSLEAQNM